jgi:hypothetical protein
MNRTTSLALALLAIAAALPAAAQESGGLPLRGNPLATLDLIDANRGCPLSSTSVTVGVNKAFATGSSATQRLGTAAGPIGNGGCRPLVTTQVAAGANLALGSGSQAGQSINVRASARHWPPSASPVGSTSALEPGPIAAQHIQNLTNR